MKPSYDIMVNNMTPDPPVQDMKFTINPVKKKPTRKYRKGSKYDPVIANFVKANVPLVEVEVEGKTASYLSTQLGKRLEDNPKLAHISVSTANGMCYLENSKVTATPKPKATSE